MATTATAQPANLPPRVALTVSGLSSAATATITRTDPDGRARAVRSADPATLTAGGWTGYDYEAPFGQPVTYTATPNVGSAETSGSVTLAATDVWLLHPSIPDLSVVLDNVEKFEARARAARAAVHQPLGRATPIVVTETRSSVSSGLSVITETLAERDAMWALLADGNPLLLDVPPGLGWGIGAEWISVGDATEEYLSPGLSDARRFTLPYTVVDRPVGAVTAQWAWSGLVAGYATWADVTANYVSWGDVVTNTTTTP